MKKNSKGFRGIFHHNNNMYEKDDKALGHVKRKNLTIINENIQLAKNKSNSTINEKIHFKGIFHLHTKFLVEL